MRRWFVTEKEKVARRRALEIRTAQQVKPSSNKGDFVEQGVREEEEEEPPLKEA